MNMFTYKNEVIFGLAIAFALKAVATADWLSAGLATLFFTAHHIERFFSSQSVEAQVRARVNEIEASVTKKVADIEAALRITIEKTTHLSMAQGLTNRVYGQQSGVQDPASLFFGGKQS